MKTAPNPLILLACSFAFVIVQLDVTIVNVALPQIGQELRAGVDDLQWVVDAYTLGFAVFLLSAGVLGDRFGSRLAFLSGFGLFTVASLACAVAPDAPLLNVARAAQGVGAALLVPSSLAILNAAYAHDKHMLAKAVSWWTAAGGVSIAAGPVLGAALMELAGWRSIFWVNVPLCVAGFWLTLRVAPAMAAKDPRRAFDVPGQLLSVVALTAFIGAVIEVHALGWTHGLVLGGLGLALAAGALFLAVEARSAAPMLPLTLFRKPGFGGAVMFGVLVNFAYYGVIFVLSLYLQRMRGFTAMQAGLIFLPLTGTFIFSNIVSGRLSARAGVRPPMIAGALIAAAGYALLCVLGIAPGSGFMAMLPGLVLIPAGMGLAVPAMTTFILSSVERHQAGTASGVLNMARQVGGALGVAVYGALAAGPSGVRLAVGVSAGLLLAACVITYYTMYQFNCGKRYLSTPNAKV
ncbi:MFS transporter [Pseudoduganella namucuonensis]|uniref:MFS transporter, DHA2 family, methylenomycin A resistance protein n=1 Tax=Pseudoduganella namucuonensis TaxID=1035707 RepID=A0A1I7LJT6_9BURK|nr:MFS transporter [Pseudoduganella namucuonensis]SFV09890.1 MFS transporter, DHA2 family, methylenomycin A resistance protein [Pseudoduganella namucuonensis]